MVTAAESQVGKTKRRLSHLSALAFALSSPLRVLRLNRQLAPAMHVPREGEQGLMAPQVLGGWGSPCAQQRRGKWGVSISCHLPWQETAKRHTPLPSFWSQGSFPMAPAKADNSKATWRGPPAAGMVKSNHVLKAQWRLGSPLSSLLTGTLPLRLMCA